MTKPMPGDRPRAAGEDLVAWAVDTGRIAASEQTRWRGKPEQVQRVIFEALAPGTARAIPATIAAAAPAGPPAGADPRWFAANPALDDLARQHPAIVRAAAGRTTAPPTLFAGGDLPPFTASGIDPHVLMSVPWPVRHRIAATTSRAEALDLIEEFADPADAPMASEYMRDMGNRDYQARVLKWAADVATDYDRALPDPSRMVAASGGTKPVADMTDDEIDAAIFGELDRRRVAERDAHERAVLEGRAVGSFDAPEIRRRQQLRAARGEV
jgi:hypothetical protein